MDSKDRRKFNRYDADAFVKMTFLDKNELEMIGWAKNISEEGSAISICIRSSYEMQFLKELVKNKQPINVLASITDDLSLKAKYKIAWGAITENKDFYNMGLQILALDKLQRDKWDSFVEKLSPAYS